MSTPDPPLIDTEHIYDVIYADPPWSYAQSGVRGGCPYGSLTLESLKQMKIPARRARSALFLWATVPQLPVALDLMRCWKFKYKSAWIWVKRTTHGKLHFGPGFWARSCVELLLIGTRGRGMYSLVTDHAIRGLLLEEEEGNCNDMEGDDCSPTSSPNETAEQGRLLPLNTMTHSYDSIPDTHSRKPPAMRERVRGLFGGNAAELKFLELFARPPVDVAGWEFWGNEVPGFPAPCRAILGGGSSSEMDEEEENDTAIDHEMDLGQKN